MQEDDRLRARVIFLGLLVEAFKEKGFTLVPNLKKLRMRR